MNRKELDGLKVKALQTAEKANDMDTLISEIIKLPYGQVKKIMTDEVMAILKKYGYTE